MHKHTSAQILTLIFFMFSIIASCRLHKTGKQRIEEGVLVGFFGCCISSDTLWDVSWNYVQLIFEEEINKACWAKNGPDTLHRV